MEESIKMNRPNSKEYYMMMAELAATRSTCMSRSVGAVIVKNKQVISTGYNGAPRKLTHCKDAGCIRRELNVESGKRHELCRGVHAEQNAVLQAAMYGTSVKGATVYSTTYPCIICAKILINAGIRRIIYRDSYKDKLSAEILEQSDVEVKKLKKMNYEVCIRKTKDGE